MDGDWWRQWASVAIWIHPSRRRRRRRREGDFGHWEQQARLNPDDSRSRKEPDKAPLSTSRNALWSGNLDALCEMQASPHSETRQSIMSRELKRRVVEWRGLELLLKEGRDGTGICRAFIWSLLPFAPNVWPIKCFHRICCFRCLVKYCQNRFHIFFKPVPPSDWRCLGQNQNNNQAHLARLLNGPSRMLSASIWLVRQYVQREGGAKGGAKRPTNSCLSFPLPLFPAH